MGKKRGRTPSNRARKQGVQIVAGIIIAVMVLSVGAYYASLPGGSAFRGGASGGGSAVGGGLVQVDQGNAAYDAGDYVAAIGYYEKALVSRPGDVNILVDLGTSYFYKQPSDPARALYYYDKALEVDSKFPNAHFNKAVVQATGLGDYAGAVKSLNDLLKIVPSGPQADKAREMLAKFEPLAKTTPGSSAPSPAAPSSPSGQVAQPGTAPAGQGPTSPLTSGFGR